MSRAAALRAFAYTVPVVVLGLVVLGWPAGRGIGAGTAAVLVLVVAAWQSMLCRAHANLLRRAGLDALTGLPNRAHLLERLGRALAARSPVGLIFLDLDGFKRVNDTYGHAVGDCVLAQVGSRLLATAGPGAFVARYGGDEFGILVDGGEAETIALADRIATAVGRPVHVRQRTGSGPSVSAHDGIGPTVSLSASVGVTVARAGAVEEVLGAADAAMYAVKPGPIGIRTVIPNRETEIAPA
jgi:diguanylate cyclase (GGDEF)-like protein